MRSRTAREIQIPPVSANASSRDAILTSSPNSESDVLVLGDTGIAIDHRALGLRCTPHRIHHARKLHQHAVAGVLDDAAAVLENRINQLTEMRFDPFVGAFLIGTHKPAVTGDVGDENGGQPAFDAFRGQSGAPRPHEPNRLSALGRTLLLRVRAGISFSRLAHSRFSWSVPSTAFALCGSWSRFLQSVIVVQ